eukprot:3695937-Pleurochrysis_carterae.AAC.1
MSWLCQSARNRTFRGLRRIQTLRELCGIWVLDVMAVSECEKSGIRGLWRIQTLRELCRIRVLDVVAVSECEESDV